MNTKTEALVTITVVRKDGTVVEYPTLKNMITDQGLSLITTGNLNQYSLLEYFYIGSDGSPNYRVTGDNVLSCTASTVTSTEATFTSLDATNKRPIQFADNSVARITTYISPTQVQIDQEFSLSGISGRIWETDIVKLKAYTSHNNTIGANTYGVEYGYDYEFEYCGIDQSRLKWICWKTRRFDFVSSGTTIREVGWSNVSNSTSGLCGRLALDEAVVVQEAEMVFVKIALVQYLPVGPVSADPVFGLPAVIRHITQPGYDVAAPYMNGLRTLDLPVVRADTGSIYIRIVYSGGTSDKIVYDGTTTTKPYTVQYGTAQWIDINMPNIAGYYFTVGNYAGNAFGYEFELVRPSVTTTQLLRISPKISVDRDYPDFPGSTPQLPTIVPSSYNLIDGSVPVQFKEVPGAPISLLFTTSYGNFMVSTYDPISEKWWMSGNKYDAKVLGSVNPDGTNLISYNVSPEINSVLWDDTYLYCSDSSWSDGARTNGTLYPIQIKNRSLATVYTRAGYNNSQSYFVKIGGNVIRCCNNRTTILNGNTETEAGFTLPHSSWVHLEEYENYYIMFNSGGGIYGVNKTTMAIEWKTLSYLRHIGVRHVGDGIFEVVFVSNETNKAWCTQVEMVLK